MAAYGAGPGDGVVASRRYVPGVEVDEVGIRRARHPGFGADSVRVVAD